MSNVVALNVPNRKSTREQRLSDLIRIFADQRRVPEDVFWLKENAELLNILECTQTVLNSTALNPHAVFYDTLESRIEFFPQYYRFILSICLDLEDLGMPGGKGEMVANWVARQDLVAAELSDLQRGEAQRLLARRGIKKGNDTALSERLHRFINASETFSMPNKKAAYELTHIVFYLSEYGRRAPELSEAALISLEFAGLLAFLDQNVDLLSEVCVAMRYAGALPPQIWENWLEEETHRFALERGPHAPSSDDYHDYFVCNWAMATAGHDNFLPEFGFERLSLHRTTQTAGPLRTMSECMFRMQDTRCDDWHVMRDVIADNLDETGYGILTEAERSSTNFQQFFAGFARTALRKETI